ncbi:DUF2092 domain-containing protein [bacterium]|nr:DUF2092 domain-containing protein [bacterium]
MKMLKIFASLFGAIGVLLSATLPSDVEANLDRIMNTLAAYDTTKLEFQLNAQLAGLKATADGVAYYDNSGKFRIEIAKLVYLVNDGKNFWFYTPLTNEYSHGEMPLQDIIRFTSPGQTNPTLGPFLSFILKQIFTSEDFALQSATVQEETIEDKKAIALTFVSKKGFQVKIWADGNSYNLLQIGLMAKIGEEILTVYLKVIRISLMPSLPPNLFVFTPPPGAKEAKGKK